MPPAASPRPPASPSPVVPPVASPRQASPPVSPIHPPGLGSDRPAPSPDLPRAGPAADLLVSTPPPAAASAPASPDPVLRAVGRLWTECGGDTERASAMVPGDEELRALLGPDGAWAVAGAMRTLRRGWGDVEDVLRRVLGSERVRQAVAVPRSPLQLDSPGPQAVLERHRPRGGSPVPVNTRLRSPGPGSAAAPARPVRATARPAPAAAAPGMDPLRGVATPRRRHATPPARSGGRDPVPVLRWPRGTLSPRRRVPEPVSPTAGRGFVSPLAPPACHLIPAPVWPAVPYQHHPTFWAQ
eukprot:TRINITY_DN9483_c0_g2_i1.p3 TRINITY_DN9483_c0_g2~~TRINITY_DN9483_c0_g2_i1.p3  ORF type:complete len:335 (+),score=103.35 TRINITY_DN9483_c0_g2_i1:111-1007(+)